jgi:hypothetical protein
MNFPSGENSALVVITYVLEGVLSCMMRVKESFSHDCYNRMHSQSELTGLEALELRPFSSPAENNFSKRTPVITKGHFCKNMPALSASYVLQLEVNVPIVLHPDINDLAGYLIPLLLLRLTP